MNGQTHVLYVDDEPNLLEIGKLFLERLGEFTVTTVTGPEKAIPLIADKAFDVIVSDFQMPRMDGIAFLKYLKSEGNATPFILFSGKGREEVVIDALNNGADFYLQKGGDPMAQFTELAHKIQSAVNHQRAEQLAKDNERRLCDIINFLPDATFAIDEDGKVIAWNLAIEEMTGIPASEMLGRGDYEYSIPFYKERRPILIDLISIFDEELSNNTYTIIKKEEDILIAETTLPHPLGKNSVLLGKASHLYNHKGECIGAIESIRDITGQKKAEEALRESERKLNAMASNIPGVVYRFYVNPDGTTGFDYISERSWQILGLENDPSTFFEKVTNGIIPKDRERFKNSVHYAICTKTLWEFCGQYVKPSGEKICARAISNPIFENEKIIFDGVILDITAQKRAERALIESENLYRTIFETTGAATIIIEDDQLISRANSGFASISGFSIDELEGKRNWVEFVLPEDFERTKQHHADCKVNPYGETCVYEFGFINRYGEMRYCINNINYIPGSIRCVASIVDITYRKQVETELQHNHEELMESYEKLAASEEELRYTIDELTRKEERMQHQSVTLCILKRIISTVNIADDLPELLTIILEEALQLLGFEAGGIYLVEPSRQTATLFCSKNFTPEFLEEITTIPIDKKPYNQVFILNEPVFIDNNDMITPNHLRVSGFQSMAGIPLLSKGVAIGAMNLVSYRQYKIPEEEKEILISIGRELGCNIERRIAEERMTPKR